MITLDLNKKHFSRYAEFRAAFELSRRGWNVYTPIYDEYIDIVATKIVCSRCGALWPVAVQTQCAHCGYYPLAMKCVNCQYIDTNLHIKKCPACDSTKLQRISGKICRHILTKDQICGQINLTAAQRCISCGKTISKAKNSKRCFRCNHTSEDFKDIEECLYCHNKTNSFKIITLQVWGSREVDEGKNFGFKMKPRDLLNDKRHFFIWIGYRGECCSQCKLPSRNCKNCVQRAKSKEEEIILIMSVDDFTGIMGSRINSRAFAVTQNDRLHPDKRTLKKGSRLDFSSFIVTPENNRFTILDKV